MLWYLGGGNVKGCSNMMQRDHLIKLWFYRAWGSDLSGNMLPDAT